MAMFGRGPLFGQDTCGVGVRLKLDNDGKIRVNELLPGSPAHVHGVHVGDAFEFIDGVEIKNKTVEEVTRMLRGPAGSTVSLRMARNTFFGRDVLNIIIQRAEIAHRKTNDKDLHGAGTLRREPSPRANAHAASKSPTNDPEHFGSAIRSMFNFGSVASDGSVGLGCEVVNGMVRVKALKPGSPAAQSGLIR
jgi:C-terminal processing protease CtpA/Prc